MACLQSLFYRRRIVAELGGRALLTADQEGKLVDWRCVLLVKIGKYRDLQQVYMPGAALAIVTHDAA
jgi:hypothetical protein